MVCAQIKSLSCLASGDAPFEGETGTVAKSTLWKSSDWTFEKWDSIIWDRPSKGSSRLWDVQTN